MTPTEKQDLWNAILKLNNQPYIGSGYDAYNNVKNPALRGGLYNWKYRDMRELYEQLVKYCELGESEACWRVLLGYKTKIYPAYLRKIYQALSCSITPPPTCPALGDVWHGGTVFSIDGNDYYMAIDTGSFYNSFVGSNCIGCFAGTQPNLQNSFNNTLALSQAPFGPGNLSREVLITPYNGYNDWFVPSIGAFNEIANYITLTPKTQYWSSTEEGTDNIFVFDDAGVPIAFPRGDSGPSAIIIRKETCI